MEKQNLKAWLYLLPAFLFLGAFMIYPLIDVFVYSFEEGYNSASQTFYGVGMYNYSYVLHDPYFLQALKNTFILVIITVPVSTGLALLISAALSSIKPLRDLFQTIFFLPYVTNTLAVGLVFMILFKKTPYSDGLINLLIQFFGGSSVDFIDGPYWAKMFVLCFYTIWIVMPFKILILTSALASVNPMYYNAARVDGTSRFRMFTKITLPMISPMVFYLIITGFIGAFKAYSDAVALFGTNLNAAEMNTIVGYVYDMLYGDSGGYPSYASAAAILLFAIVLTITCINLLVSKKACPLCIGKEVFVMSDVTSDYEKIEKRTRIRGNIRNGIVYFFLCLWALIVLFPFYWMVLTSVKSYGSYNAEYIPKFFTLSPTLQNYVDAFTTVSLGRYLWNTLFFTVVTTAIMLVVITLAAFAFARLNFAGKDLIFTLFLSLMMIPNELVVITNFTTITNLDLRNTFTGLILPSVTSVFYIYLLRENFAQIPDELYYAAKVDGTSDLRYLRKVMVPICKPTLITIVILKVIECWNSYVWPRLITDDPDYYLVSNGIQEIRENGFGRENIPAMMAAVVVISVPLVVLFLVFRKKVMAGVARGGTKG
ncbi:MAG: ABC transporter permease subunit [Lachnospiraceae bacterium]